MTKVEINTLIDAEIKNKTVPYSISHVDVANILKNILDFAEAQGNFKEELNLVANGTFTVSAKQKLNSIAFENNSGVDMIITVNYDPAPTEDWATIALPDGSSFVDLDLGKTFGSNTTIYIGGVAGAIKLLIDRK